MSGQPLPVTLPVRSAPVRHNDHWDFHLKEDFTAGKLAAYRAFLAAKWGCYWRPSDVCTSNILIADKFAPSKELPLRARCG